MILFRENAVILKFAWKMEDFAVDLDKVLDDFEESEGNYLILCHLYDAGNAVMPL